MNKAHLVLGILGSTALAAAVWSIASRYQEIELLKAVDKKMAQLKVELEFARIIDHLDDK